MPMSILLNDGYKKEQSCQITPIVAFNTSVKNQDKISDNAPTAKMPDYFVSSDAVYVKDLGKVHLEPPLLEKGLTKNAVDYLIIW